MNIKRPIQAAALIGSALTMLIGCGARELTADEAVKYVRSRYGGTFTCIKETEATLPTRAPYTREEGGESYTGIVSTNYQLYRLTDSSGVEFELYNDYHYGCYGASNSITDNYCSRWLLAQPEVYEPLTKSDYDLTREPSGDGRNYDFVLYIEDFDDIKPAVELAYSVITDDRAILPDMGTVRNDTKSLKPQIIFRTEDGHSIGSLSFRTKMHPYATDIDVFSRLAEESFIELVEDEKIDAFLPQEAIDRDDRSVLTICDGDKSLNSVFMRTIYNDFRTSEYIGEDSEDKRFKGVAEICEAAGFKVKNNSKWKITIKKGDTKVVIERKNLRHTNDLNTGVDITLNGKKYYPEGMAEKQSDGYYLELTTADYYNLFGIDFDFDFDSGKAYIKN